MENIALTKQQSTEIAKAVYGDVKRYCHDNFERYFAWYIDDIRKAKGKPPLEAVTVFRNPCLHCDRYSQQANRVETHCGQEGQK